MFTCENTVGDYKSVTHPVFPFLSRGVKPVIPVYELNEGCLSIERLCCTNVRVKSIYASPF